jgi:hypothetical protein
MNLKITIIFTATEEDWNITDLVDERKLSDDSVQNDIIAALMEDPAWVLKNSTFIIKEDKNSL